MKPKNGPSITELLDALAGDVVQIQKKLDARFVLEANQFILGYLNAPEAQKPLLLTAAPRRQFMAKHEVAARIAFRSEKTVGASVTVSLLNLSADIRFQREASSDSSIKLEIEQVPTYINNHNLKEQSHE